MTNKIFRSTVLVAVTVLFCSLGVTMGILYSYFTDVQVNQLKDELGLASIGTQQYGIAYLENVETHHFRITWVDEDGTVLFDTQVDQTLMENHANREEIQEAQGFGAGSAVRTSSTLTERTYYEAVKLQDGTVLRISANQASALSLMLGMLWPILLITGLAVFLSALLARRMAKKIVEPLNKLDLKNPLKNKTYEELLPLLRRIHQQHNQINLQVEKLRQKNEEFSLITDAMQEGLILLNSEATILSMNPAARHIFEMEEDCVGKYFLSIERSNLMRAAVNDALDKGHGDARISYHGRVYQFDLSRIESEGTVVGAVVLAFDVTDRINAEKLRREFSANVSHELKTPLQGIMGSAELMESGLVKSEDMPRFVAQIRKESSRLLNLIEDIIRLSQLDEGMAMPEEEVDMLQLALDVQASLKKNADDKQVKIEVSGEGFRLLGVRRWLYEAIYNLCDNAIKYNVQGGNVKMQIENRRLIISDTGIGIPKGHQDRVFERFYRVDKSHSKASGGTGLGLSIVKHAVLYHNALIHLDSTPGKGTTITIQF